MNKYSILKVRKYFRGVIYVLHMMKKTIVFKIAVTLLLFVYPELRGQLSGEVEKSLDSIFSFYNGKPGCAIAVVKNGKTLFQKGYGLANLEYGIPVTTETVFEANAMAKQITAACIFMLEGEGKLNLNSSLQKFFPKFPEYKEGGLTVKNLLYQTSGIRDYLAILYSQNRYYGDKLDNEDVVGLIMNQENLNYKSGSEYAYSNSNYVLLANIIEKVSGQNLKDYAAEKLFIPLGMTNTLFLESPNKIIKNRAIGYQQEGNHFVVNHFFNSCVIGPGGLQSNLEDLIKWSNNLATGAVGGKELITKLITPGMLNSGDPITYAGGLYNQNHYDIEGLSTIRHGGVWAGFRSLYYKFLNQDVAFIILSNNADTNVWVLLDELTPLFVADEIAEAQAEKSVNSNTPLQTVTLSTKEKQKFCGTFHNIVNGELRSIALKNDSLFFKRSLDMPPLHLVPVSKTELVFEIAPEYKFSFGSPNFKNMTITFNAEDPTRFSKYNSYSHSSKELKEYENEYYNKDCDVVYRIVQSDTGLKILVGDKELVSLTSMARDIFREEHFGYIQFLRDTTGNINGFFRQDNTFTNLKFSRIKTSN